eukprot:3037120-Rhodomonas_salina.1
MLFSLRRCRSMSTDICSCVHLPIARNTHRQHTLSRDMARILTVNATNFSSRHRTLPFCFNRRLDTPLVLGPGLLRGHVLDHVLEHVAVRPVSEVVAQRSDEDAQAICVGDLRDDRLRLTVFVRAQRTVSSLPIALVPPIITSEGAAPKSLVFDALDHKAIHQSVG